MPEHNIWKSVLGSTGGAFGCERQMFYRETRRLPDGKRIDTGMGERVLFGIAIDRAHRLLIARRVENGPQDTEHGTPESDLLELRDAAVRAGIESARGRPQDHRFTDDEWKLMRVQLEVAVEKLLGLTPNAHVTARSSAKLRASPGGLPIGWVRIDGTHGERISIQGLDGQVLRSDVGELGLAGQPDYLYLDEHGTILGWYDLKAGRNGKLFPQAWTEAEAVAYDLMVTDANGGVRPEWHGYVEYQRQVKPYWTATIAPVVPESIDLAKRYVERWTSALRGDDTGVSFSVRMCEECPFREPIPEAGHDGCAIGQAVIAIAPMEEPTDGTPTPA